MTRKGGSAVANTEFDTMRWERPPTHLGLTRVDVDVWNATVVELAQAQDYLETLVDESERKRAQRFHFESDRLRYIVTHGFLRLLLGSYIGCPANAIQFAQRPDGKPMLMVGGDIPDLRFSISHSHQRVLLAIANEREVGIDIEYCRKFADMATLAENLFSVRERAILRSLPAEMREYAFYCCWVRKEAYLKATGQGLSAPLHDFDVTIAPGEPAALLTVQWDAHAIEDWSLYDLPPVPEYAAALAVEGTQCRKRFFAYVSTLCTELM